MTPRQRDEQEMRNGVEVMAWIDHLTAHPDVPLDLNLICYFNKLILQNTDRDTWAGRPRSTVDWQAPEDWSRRRAIVSPEEPGLASRTLRQANSSPTFHQTIRWVRSRMICWGGIILLSPRH